MENLHRYIARIEMEASTPLMIGSGEASLVTDALVCKDQNNLPMIPGTSLAGLLRGFMPNSSFFGEAKGDRKNKNLEIKGSRLVVSSAVLKLNAHSVSEGLMEVPLAIQEKFNKLPVRQHVRITSKGAADTANHGLFDNEVIHKGLRFVFELELRFRKETTENTTEESQFWYQLLLNLYSKDFRLGQGTRKGYGELKVLNIHQQQFNLKNDLDAYLAIEPSLASIQGLNKITEAELKSKLDNKENNDDTSLDVYKLTLRPDSAFGFFMFSQGSGDNEADNKFKEEEVATYQNSTIEFKKTKMIPASSIKGAIAHRVCYHYNKLKKRYAGSPEASTTDNNEAVLALFGQKAQNNSGARGKVIINDYHFEENFQLVEKIFNHVAIDRFTGGGVDGALFSEKGLAINQTQTLPLEIFVEKSAYQNDQDIHTALNKTLEDLCSGLLPLGGMTTKGYGIFVGDCSLNSETIFDYQNNN
jgi:CRISPR/Cas system CSM-associated protein Csm3 (group 7 of RAMP superfamily)